MSLNDALGNEQTEAHAPPIILCQLDEAVTDERYAVRADKS